MPPLLSGCLTVQFVSGTGRALRFTPTRFAERRMLFKVGRLAQLRRSSRRSVRPVRRSSRRSSRPVRRALRRSMPGVPVAGGGVAGVWAPACDAVRTAAGAARPSMAAHPMRERARRREIKSEVMISLISITPMSVVQQDPWLVRIFDRSTNVDRRFTEPDERLPSQAVPLLAGPMISSMDTMPTRRVPMDSQRQDAARAPSMQQAQTLPHQPSISWHSSSSSFG